MKKRALVSVLASAAGFALAYRGAAGRQGKAASALRPSGSGGGLEAKAGRVFVGRSGDRGAGAAVPSDIPPRGWFDVAKRTVMKFNQNELMAEGASVTFFALLSIFPALTAIVSIYGLFADPAAIEGRLDAAKGLVPGGGLDILHEQIARLTASPTSGLSLGAGVGILAALWSANQGSKAMLSALNRVQEQPESRSFIRLTAVSFSFTIGGILSLAAAVGVGFVLPAIFSLLGLASIADTVIRIARWPLLLIGLTVALATLYRFGPSEHRTRWQWATPGGIFSALAWVCLSFCFSWFVGSFGSYNKTYGSLGAVIGFMTWIWLSSTLLLVGAQINAELEDQTDRKTASA